MARGWQKIYFSFILLAAISLATGHGFATDQEDIAVSGVVASMKRLLKLTDAQGREVASVVREYVQQVQALKKQGVAGPLFQNKIKFLREDMDSNLEHYLTEDQMALWKSQMAQAQGSDNLVVGGAPAGDKKSPSATEARSLIDNGVLESRDSSKMKTSGVW